MKRLQAAVALLILLFGALFVQYQNVVSQRNIYEESLMSLLGSSLINGHSYLLSAMTVEDPEARYNLMTRAVAHGDVAFVILQRFGVLDSNRFQFDILAHLVAPYDFMRQWEQKNPANDAEIAAWADRLVQLNRATVSATSGPHQGQRHATAKELRERVEILEQELGLVQKLFPGSK